MTDESVKNMIVQLVVGPRKQNYSLLPSYNGFRYLILSPVIEALCSYCFFKTYKVFVVFFFHVERGLSVVVISS